jgi:hypothetical protein
LSQAAAAESAVKSEGETEGPAAAPPVYSAADSLGGRGIALDSDNAFESEVTPEVDLDFPDGEATFGSEVAAEFERAPEFETPGGGDADSAPDSPAGADGRQATELASTRSMDILGDPVLDRALEL